jgi:phosphoglycolate phosphatase-like HAD superfamily hydrolase
MPEGQPGLRAVAFDFDGTLIQSPALKRALFFELFGARGVPASMIAELLDSVPGDRYDLCREVAARAGLADSPAALAEEYTRLAEGRLAACPEVPGASQTLRELAPRLALYISSATPEAPLRRLVELRGLERYVKEVLGRPASKPEHLRRICAAEGCAAAQLLMVGDGLDDLAAALELGCAFIAVHGGSAEAAEPRPPVIGDLYELKGRIAGMLGQAKERDDVRGP